MVLVKTSVQMEILKLSSFVTGFPTKLKKSNFGHPDPKSAMTFQPFTPFPDKMIVVNPGQFFFKFFPST